MSSTISAFGFLFNLIHHLLAIIFIARLAFQWLGITMTNPIAQFVLKFTQPIISPLQRIFPTIKRFNFAALAALLILNLIFVGLYFFLAGADIPMHLIGIMAITNVAQQALDFLFWSIIIQVIFSWLPNAGFHPLAQIAYQINAPLLRPLQRILPTMSGIDFSPIVVIVAIKFIEILFLGH